MTPPPRQGVKVLFLDDLEDQLVYPAVRTSKLPKEERDCPVCKDPMVSPVILHDKHVLCNACAQTWLKTHNTCPQCRFKLFERNSFTTVHTPHDGPMRISTNDDRANIDCLRNLRHNWLYGENEEIRARAERKWHTVWETRGRLLQLGTYCDPLGIDYDHLHPLGKRTTSRRAFSARIEKQRCRVPRPVRAEHLIAQLKKRNAWLAHDANRSKAQKPGLAAHPEATCMMWRVFASLRALEGKMMASRNLERYPQMPFEDGVNNYIFGGMLQFLRYMRMDVARMHEGVDVHPVGQAVHVHRGTQEVGYFVDE